MTSERQYDVIVVGAGSAALNAALSAVEQNLKKLPKRPFKKFSVQKVEEKKKRDTTEEASLGQKMPAMSCASSKICTKNVVPRP